MRRLTRIKKNMLRRRAAKRRSMASAVILILLLSAVLQTFAFTPNTPKEEVIYVNLNTDGTVDAIYVVNSFDLSEDGKIIDYGDYTSFRQLTESGEIVMENETITIDAAAGKVYYEGKLKNESIPWDFRIRYFLDDLEYRGEDLAGKSGNLKITIDVGENPNFHVSREEAKENLFFKNLALQLGMTFDASKTKSIEAEGAVIANAGKNKQIMFTVLPGRKSSFSVTAEVTKFEMEGITINGIPLDMDFDIDDEDDEMNKELKKLKDGVKELDDGARELRDGVRDLREGTEELKDGVEELNDGVIEMADGTGELRENTDEFVDGVKELDDGVADLKKGTKDLKEGTKELDEGMGRLVSGAAGIKSGASELSEGLSLLAQQNASLDTGANQIFAQMINMANAQLPGNPLTAENFESVLNSMLEAAENAALNTVMADIGSIQAEAAGIVLGEIISENPEATPEEISEIMTLPETSERIGLKVQEIIQFRVGEILMDDPDYVAIYTMREQLKGFRSFLYGLLQYTGGVAALASGASELSSGIGSFYSGLKKIDKGTAELRDGAEELYDGVIDLKDGTAKLLDGAIELKDGIIELDDGVIELKDGVLELFDGAIELHDGVIELHDGTIEMAKGTMEFKDKTADIEKKLKDKIREKIDELLGKSFKPVSFVSENNINIESVQFVMKTSDISIEEVELPPYIPPKPQTFLDRLLNLFTFLLP